MKSSSTTHILSLQKGLDCLQSIDSDTLKNQVQMFEDQSPQIENFHKKFKLNKRIIKEWAEVLRKQKSSFQKILNLSFPPELPEQDSCCYQTQMSQALDQTRSMTQNFMKAMEKYEFFLLKQHADLKEEGKNIYKVSRENKEEFKSQKASFESSSKKFKEIQLNNSSNQLINHLVKNKRSVIIKIFFRKYIAAFMQESMKFDRERDDQNEIELNQALYNTQATQFLMSTKILFLKAEKTMMRSTNSCLKSAQMLTDIMKHPLLGKLDKQLDSSVLLHNIQKQQEIENKICESNNIINHSLFQQYKQNISNLNPQTQVSLSNAPQISKKPLCQEVQRSETQVLHQSPTFQDHESKLELSSQKSSNISSQSSSTLSKILQRQIGFPSHSDFVLSDITPKQKLQNFQLNTKYMQEKQGSSQVQDNLSKEQVCKICNQMFVSQSLERKELIQDECNKCYFPNQEKKRPINKGSLSKIVKKQNQLDQKENIPCYPLDNSSYHKQRNEQQKNQYQPTEENQSRQNSLNLEKK